MQKNVSLSSARIASPSPVRSRHEVGDPCPLLSELELEAIRRGLRAGARGPIVVSWVERLLADHDERVRRDRALAVRLLSDVARAGATTSTDRSIEGY
jgi:serine/threonine protein kinase HipA of HipAB toxin-antitoxin module